MTTPTVKIVRLAEVVGADFPKGGDFSDFQADYRDGQDAESIRDEINALADAAEPVEVADVSPLAARDDSEPAPLEPENFASLQREKPERTPETIGGIGRCGSVTTFNGGTKTRKSWVMCALVAAALSGGRVQWFGHPVTPGRVLLIDGELTRATLYFRLRKVFEACGLDLNAIDGLDIFALRGHTKDFSRAMASAKSKGPGYYTHIILDPLYTCYPNDPHFSENDNAAMRRLYDDLIVLAGETYAGLVVVHHLTKGSQAEKSLTDLGSGAGAISRAGDGHLALRLHREKDVVVFDGVVRDFPELIPTCWQWTFPTFTEAPDLDPADLAGRKPAKKSITAEFMEGAKSEQWTPQRFAETCITDAPAILEVVEIAATGHGMKRTEARRLLKAAVAGGNVHKWDGTPGKPLRYSRLPQPLLECTNVAANA